MRGGGKPFGMGDSSGRPAKLYERNGHARRREGVWEKVETKAEPAVAAFSPSAMSMAMTA